MIILKNPFSLKMKLIEQKDFLSKMEMSLKEIILIEENVDEKYENNEINSSSFYESKPLFSYPNDIPLILKFPNLNCNII